MKIKGFTLLSKEEYEACKDIIPKKDCSWWLRSVSKYYSENAAYIHHDGTLQFYRIDGNYGVAPALICDHHLPRGSKVEFADHKWTVISEDMIFCDDVIGYFPFNQKRKAGNSYKNSSVKAYVKGWFEAHKNDPIELVKVSSQTRSRIDDLLRDVNSAEIASQIASDNLSGWISRWKEAMNQALDEAFATGGDTHDASV